jgi:hypothetical protein
MIFIKCCEDNTMHVWVIDLKENDVRENESTWKLRVTQEETLIFCDVTSISETSITGPHDIKNICFIYVFHSFCYKRLVYNSGLSSSSNRFSVKEEK